MVVDKWSKFKFNTQSPSLNFSWTMDAKGGADTGDPTPWKPFSLTYVEYQEGDVIGLVLAASVPRPPWPAVAAPALGHQGAWGRAGAGIRPCGPRR